MSERFTLPALRTSLPGGTQSAGEDQGRRALPEAARRLRQRIPAFACPRLPNWLVGLPGPCPDGGETQWMEDMNGKAAFMPGGAVTTLATEEVL